VVNRTIDPGIGDVNSNARLVIGRRIEDYHYLFFLLAELGKKGRFFGMFLNFSIFGREARHVTTASVAISVLGLGSTFKLPTPRGEWTSPHITASQGHSTGPTCRDSSKLTIFILTFQFEDTVSLLPRHLCSHPRWPQLWRQCGERCTSSKLRNQLNMAGTAVIPTETYLDRQWTTSQASTVMYRFVGNSPQCHPIFPVSFPALCRATLSSHDSSKCELFFSAACG
jgi:hypothetical protein